VDWDARIGPAIERELRRHPGARRAYDTDADYRMTLSLAEEHLTATAQAAERQHLPRLVIVALVRDTIARLVADGAAAAEARERAKRWARV
jgi:hypothetical protein